MAQGGSIQAAFVFMDSDDKSLVKVSGIQSLSSSVQSTPDKNGQSEDDSRSPKSFQEFSRSGLKDDIFLSSRTDKKQLPSSSKGLAEQVLKLSKKPMKNQDQKKAVVASPKELMPLKKHNRKNENPVRIPIITEQCSDYNCFSSWVCKNSACRATLSIEDTFCRRCSCCICHMFDDNKDPSLWLECASETVQRDHCGLSSHIECALQREKVGVVDLGQSMQLDGSYCCPSCGKVSGILGWWKKQLNVAKDARRVDVLCHRILLCYRLLVGTTKFKELHEIIEEAKSKLETEVGPIDGVSAKMARGIVSRLSVAGDVQTLCSLAIGKADEWLALRSSTAGNHNESSLPAACRFFFEEVTSASVVIVLIELPNTVSCEVKGYKLWYCKTREENYTNDPVSEFPRAQRRILVSNLLPCSEYSFRIVSFTEEGDLGHSEAKCFTKSKEIFHKDFNSAAAPVVNLRKEIGGCSTSETDHGSPTLPVESDSAGFKVRDLGKICRMAWDQGNGGFEKLCNNVDSGKCCEVVSKAATKSKVPREDLSAVSRELDLNVASVPDLNEELIPPIESSRDEDNNGCTLVHAVEVDDDVISGGKIEVAARSHGSGDSQNWNHQNAKVVAVESNGKPCRKRGAAAGESDSTLINGSPLRVCNGSGSLDENFEECVKIIRWLECEGYIEKEFRLKLLTWFSLRSTEQERRVVNTFIQTLIDDPSSLAGQLVDSFSDIVSCKKQRNGFCSKLWH